MNSKIIYKLPIKLFAFILLLSSVCSAQTSVFGFSGVDWVFLSYAVILVILGVLGIAFMLSRIFALRELEAWVKDETSNIIISIAILVLFTIFIGVIDNLSSSLASDILSSSQSGGVQYWIYSAQNGRWIQSSTYSCPTPCHIYLARAFLGSLYERYGSVIKGISSSFFVSKLYETLSIGTAVDIQIFQKKMTLSFGVGAFPELISYNKLIETVLSEYLKIITALKMQEIALVYLTSFAGELFILGIITRSVWFLRKFGGLMIALGVGIYVFVPMVYVLGWYTMDRSAITFGNPQINQISFGTDDIESMIGSIGRFVGGSSSLVDINSLYSDYDGSRLTRLGLFDALGRAYLSITVLPFLAIFITLGFVRHFSPMIGGDPEIAGLTRIL